jgi:hypothetical protein
MNEQQILDRLGNLIERQWWAILFQPILPALLVFNDGKWRLIPERANDTDLDLERWRRAVAVLRPQAVALVGMATSVLFPYRVVAAVEFRWQPSFVWMMKWTIEEEGLGERAPLQVNDLSPQYESLFDPPQSLSSGPQDVVLATIAQALPSPVMRTLLLMLLSRW